MKGSILSLNTGRHPLRNTPALPFHRAYARPSSSCGAPSSTRQALLESTTLACHSSLPASPPSCWAHWAGPEHSANILLLSVLPSWAAVTDRVPQTGWPKTTKVYPLQVLETRSPKSRCWRDHVPPEGSEEEESILVSAIFWRFSATFACPWLVDTSLTPISACLHMAWSPYVCISASKFPSWYQDSSHIGFEAHPTPLWPHLNLSISATTLFLNKVTFTGSKHTWIGGTQLYPAREEISVSTETWQLLLGTTWKVPG